MPGATVPDDLAFPVIGDPAAPRAQIAALADTTQAALNNRMIYTFRWETTADMLNQVGMAYGDLGYNKQTNLTMVYETSNAWGQLGGDDIGGCHLLIPSSVSGATVNGLGMIVPTTGAKAVSINGVFSSRYTHYRLAYSYDTGDANGSWIRLRNNGVDYTASEYSQQAFGGSGTTLINSSTLNNSFMGVAAAGHNVHFGHIDIFNPGHSNFFKQFEVHNTGSVTGGMHTNQNGGWIGNGASLLGTFDGLTFSLSTQTTNPFLATRAWFKVYGYV